MQIKINGHHVEVTPALHDYVMKKFEKIERHFDRVNNVNVVLSVEKLRHKAEATVLLNGAEVFADSEDDNMYAAIDSLVDKLDRQVKKHKEKKSDHHRKEGGISG